MKLININIEGDKHFDTVIPFLEKEKPDVLCLQARSSL
jgi:exonuclease III